MKKISVFAVLALQVLGFISCNKEKGNYSYHPINEISFAGFDTINGYKASFGDTLSISPVLTYSMDAGGTHQYSYEWSVNQGFAGDRVISTEKNLKVRIDELPGSYPLQYRVTDLTTGVLFHIRTTLLVRTDVYEGYLVLNDVGGNTRLDMLSYDAVGAKFTQYTDVLKRLGSALPTQGQPYKVLCSRAIQSAFNYSDSTYGIYLLTASGTNRIHPETFSWTPTYDLRYEVTGDIPAGFKADNLRVDPQFYYLTYYMTSGNNVYNKSGAGTPVYNLPINKYVGKPLFKASPWVVSDGTGGATLFNMDNGSFAVTTRITATNVTDPTPPVAGELAYPKGNQLVWMDRSSGGNAVAIIRNPGTGIDTLVKFLPGANPTYVKTLNATDIDKATHFAVSNNPEYLFYSVGGKVYEYDLSLQTSKLMLDKSPAEISYLSFEQFTHTSLYPSTYGVWMRYLSVGVYDPAGTAGANGTLEQYGVVDANEPLVFKRSWTGFGRIVSVAYRER
ncbi:hypothetical protein DCC81_16120 [Chitinophaga parva]|uniref:PKD-like family protein n=1 Tax=Chitinophaga parva TaxID=2169414 RepID=A0A2T7BHM4_9BACT|nr:PKD-like family lipoprotein [Chitinophaga parva]PUZ25786.1 hypothetical protein DCC81_16120 [Chitinophaga parva]